MIMSRRCVPFVQRLVDWQAWMSKTKVLDEYDPVDVVAEKE